MDATYPLFAAADPLFYDTPKSTRVESCDAFAPTVTAAWDTWEQRRDETWSFWMPAGVRLPEQGWKIHVSATLSAAATALAVASTYCNQNSVPFKFLRDHQTLRATLSKDGDRRVAGKFITIYPTSPADLHSHLIRLDEALAGLPGPYVLSDLRWADGPVHVRYGAFTPQFVNNDGADVPAILDLDSGTLVPDVRTTGFHVPPWVSIPDFLQAQLNRLDMTPPDGLPQIRGAVHFSNAGGVYEADLDGRPIILKEARPHIGWTPDGRNAVERLSDEAAVLASLSDLVPAPEPLGMFAAHGHAFLAMERIDAPSLNSAVVARNPLSGSDANRQSRLAYRDWATRIADSLRQAIEALHAAGRVHGDLHPRNVLVRDDETIVLIDFEMSRTITDDRAFVVGAPGYVAPDERTGIESDLYAVACIELFMFIPLIPLLQLDATKVQALVREAGAQFELGSVWIESHLRVLTGRRVSRQDAPPARTAPNAAKVNEDFAGTVAAIARTLVADSTLSRRDRLWPGDPAQFSEPPASLAHGALGVLTALHHAGVEPSAQHLAWVEASEHDADSFRRLGLFDGLAGAVWAYRRLELDQVADQRLVQLRNAPYGRLGIDLYGGLPGVGLTFLAHSHRVPQLRDTAVDIAMRLQERWRREEPVSQVATGAGGLLHGATGTALFALRLFEDTGDREHLRLAIEAIEYDLYSLRTAPDGSLQVDEGWRLLPYLGNGSAGIGIVLTQLLTHLPDHSRFLETLAGIASAATAPFSAQSGLFHGRAGLIQFLLMMERTQQATTASSAALNHHISQLELHALRRGDQLRFAGDGLLRASCDLATGTAGVLATLVDYGGRTREESVCFPYLTPQRDVEDHLPLPAARPGRGGEMNGIPLVLAGA